MANQLVTLPDKAKTPIDNKIRLYSFDVIRPIKINKDETKFVKKDLFNFLIKLQELFLYNTIP